MPRPNGTQTITQTRTFTYDVNGKVLIATNPETGLVTNTYDSSTGLLLQKVDAKNNKVTYGYDSYKRVVEIRRYEWTAGSYYVEKAEQATRCYYDYNPYDGTSGQNLAGRLAVTETYSKRGGANWNAPGGGNNWEVMTFREMYSYSASGLMTKKRLYVGGDPVGYVDPQGLFACDAMYSLEQCGGGSTLGGEAIGICFDIANSHGLDGLSMLQTIGQCAALVQPGAPLLAALLAQSPPPPSCSISVAYSGSPRGGQRIQGLVGYGPTNNNLGPYSTIGVPGMSSSNEGWFFGVQIQGSLTGDPNPANWTASQVSSTTGTVTLQGVNGQTATVQNNVASHDDSPDTRATSVAGGRYDWLDIPGFGLRQEGWTVKGANQTMSFTSTLTHTSGATCSVNWSVHLSGSNGRLSMSR